MESQTAAGKKMGISSLHTYQSGTQHFSALSLGSELAWHHPGAASAKPGAAMRFTHLVNPGKAPFPAQAASLVKATSASILILALASGRKAFSALFYSSLCLV